MNLEGLADVVVLAVKNALAPVLERLALVEQENVHLKAGLATLTELRDRLIVVETKAALPAPVLDLPAPVDLTPVLERVGALEVTIKAVGDGERQVAQVIEAFERFKTAADAKLAIQPITATDVELMFRKSVEPVQAMVADARERLIAVETRAPIPGPPGKDGIDGKSGADGQHGKDGLGFEDMDVEFDGDRTITLSFERGDLKKAWPLTLPYLRYQNVFIDGKAYTAGDVVTWAGSTWHANKDTSAKPGEGSKDWTLIVKRGRDGKDGKDR